MIQHIAPRRRLFTARRGTVFVAYSSFMLLVAIAAIALLTQVRGGPNGPPHTTTDLSG